METQVLVEMADGECREGRTKEPVEEITQDQFLKELYLLMKRRDTPIERIPHLGFKQIDLFVMFKTVSDLGGYHQVTAQQLWKQVYNTLGGNPRSTSAATCTRRHYEKLLLPYECHVRGILLTAVPHRQPKPFHYVSYGKDDGCGQSPAKRKTLSIPLQQSPSHLQSESHRSLFSLPLHYAHYYPPSRGVLPPYVPVASPVLTPHGPPSSALKTHFPFRPSLPSTADAVKGPLENLRYLAEQYKTTSGLTEPLNLSLKASALKADGNPVSSFAPPSPSKNLKFLNRPSTLYDARRAGAARKGGREARGDGSGEGAAAHPVPVEASEALVIDVEAETTETDEDVTEAAPKPSSPKTDCTTRPKDEREAGAEVRGLDLSQIVTGLPRERGGKVEIEIPLSVLHNWLKLYGSSATTHQAKEAPPPTQEDRSGRGQRKWADTDVQPTDLTRRASPQHQSAAEDLRLRKAPSPTLTAQTTGGSRRDTSHDHFTGYSPFPSGGVPNNAASRDVRPFDQKDVGGPRGSRSPNSREDKETRAPPAVRVKTDPGPLGGQQGFASKFYTGDVVQGVKRKAEAGALDRAHDEFRLRLPAAVHHRRAHEADEDHLKLVVNTIFLH
ncbi:AT-rich interaction domain 6 [Embiotoca jacksoni]|uniref:AT-rich interaction domain 6 n=1 Tax=Embiotoca jacksoni TaxID=100190 RepID=UPI003703D697